MNLDPCLWSSMLPLAQASFIKIISEFLIVMIIKILSSFLQVYKIPQKLLSLAQESAFLLTGRTHQWKYCLKCSPQPCRLALAPRYQSPRWASHCVWDVGLGSMRLWGSFLSPCCRHKRQGLAFHGHNYEGTFEGNLSATKECYPQNRMKNPVLRDKSRE